MTSVQKKSIAMRRSTVGGLFSINRRENEVLDTDRHRPSGIINGLDNAINRSVALSSSKNPLWSKICPCMGYCAFCMFASISILIGILVVYYNSPAKPGPVCQLRFTPIIQNATSFDSRPRSVAVGDFNSDTKLDIAVVNSNTNNIGVLIGYSDGTFANQMTYSTGDYSHPYSIVADDLNNDKKLDLVVANYGTHNIAVFLGYGNGIFKKQATYSTSASRPLHIALGDFDNNTYLDIAVVNFGTNDIGIYLGYGNGSFIFQLKYPTAYDSVPSYIAVADVNNDNRLDLIVANNGTDNFGILFGSSNGTFARQKTYSTGYGSGPSSIVIGDFNNDNKSDVAIAKYVAHQIGIFFGNSNGTFLEKSTFSTGTSSPLHIATSDFNKDKRQDLIIIYDLKEYISVWLGHGDGTFVDERKYFTGIQSNPYFAVISEFNADNRLDVAIVNMISNNVGVFLGDNPASFRILEPYSIGFTSRTMPCAVADFNHDNHADVAVMSADDNIGILLGYGNGSFANQTKYPTGDYSLLESIAVTDFNNDTHLDVIVANSGTKSIGILLGYGDGTFREITIYFLGMLDEISKVIAGDFNNDKRPDIVITKSTKDNNVRMYLGYGNGSLPDEPTYVTNFGIDTNAVAAGDLNNDGKLDIVVVELSASILHILLGNGNGNFENAASYSSNSGLGSYSATLRDLNKDNYLDIIIRYGLNANVGILLGYGDGMFKKEILYTLDGGASLASVVVGDFNNDARLDLLLVDSDGYGMFALLGYGNGTFVNPTKIYTGLNMSYADMGDFNEDNRQDLISINYEDSTMNIFLGYDFGAFMNQTTYPTGSASRPVALMAGDFNSDNRLDIAIANSGTDSVNVLLDYGIESFTSEMLHSSAIGSQPQSVVVGDFNRDTHLDIAVSNLGKDNIGVFLGYGNGTFTREKTYSTDFESRPSSLVMSDFNNDNWSDIAVTNYGSNTIGIFYGYNYTSLSDQTIYETGIDSFPNSIVVADLNNDNKLDMVVPNYRGDNFFVFLGYNDGNFALHATYSTGSNSVPSYIAVGDFNRDDKLDLVVALSNTQGITIYLGYGNGTFVQGRTYSMDSGFQSGYICVGDFNNDAKLDIVVAMIGDIYEETLSNDSVAVFLGQGDGTFEDIKKYLTGWHSNPAVIAVADLNNDNRLDIIVANTLGNNIGILLGYGNGSFEEQKKYFFEFCSIPTSVVIADFNNDNQSDIAVLNINGNNVFIALGESNGSFSDPVICVPGNDLSPTSMVVGDFNNDDELDICISDSDGMVVIYHGNADGTCGHKITYITGFGSRTNWVIAGYFNNDNQLDFAVANAGTSNIGIFLGNGHNPFPDQITFPTGSDYKPIALTAGDLNNDSCVDLIIINEGTDNISILIGNENNTFSDPIIFSTGFGSRPVSAAVADLNKDHYLDITIADSNNEIISVFFGYGNGTFQYVKAYWIGYGSRPNSVAIDDFNNDTHVDIAVGNDGTNNVVILSGYGNGSFAILKTFSTGYNSLPSALSVGDFNSDNIPDVAVTMTGSNDIGIVSNIC